ncbi:ligase-associated DNA damage response exonuclease [Luteolibacter yonseiensis]|uniref:Ligase-associated DNA damage response exonuclease n=1 Tax=Luteolibacter yonseiensis TaxID=1144680 RepID=A0A934R2E7_9BACT|nr:ligase-associated DNA damage response exonuclease [Luteolibacter yonseiensis]MBK1814024.1 ligase-associated DNA damage response exonuclease [Luteolibacter yonseiensis]
MNANKWLKVVPEGLYCAPGDFHIDAMSPVATNVVTHGHADHARAGHDRVFVTPITADIMRTRYGEDCAREMHPVPYGEKFGIGDVTLWFEPAGHVLGSAQVVIEHDGTRVVVSGDYKRRRDPTCAPFKVTECDVFITEATFGLPVFRHPTTESEIAKLVKSLRLFPERCHAVGVYSLGKCQRVIMELREQGYVKPVYLHGALVRLCELYRRHGVDLGETIPISSIDKKILRGEIVLCPPSALADRWARSLPDVLPCNASGWMQIRGRAKQKLIELPLVISDHADWDELLQTVDDVKAREVWITHGREDALTHALEQKGIKARSLRLVGYEEEDND